MYALLYAETGGVFIIYIVKLMNKNRGLYNSISSLGSVKPKKTPSCLGLCLLICSLLFLVVPNTGVAWGDTHPFANSKTVALTHGTRIDWKPSWSPDAGRITFETVDEIFNNIWVMRRDGKKKSSITNKRITEKIYINGGDLHSFSYGVRWSTDPKKFLYVSSKDGNYDIWMCSVEAKKLKHTRLTKNKAWDGDPSWSASGDKLAFVSNRTGNGDLFVMSLTGNKGRVKQVTFNKGIDFSPRWTPDGQNILFTSKRFGNYDIYSFNVNTNSVKRLTFSSSMDRFPSISPNGKWVAYYSGRGMSIVSINGGTVHSIASDVKADNQGPSWSPSGRYIAYINDSLPMKPIYIVDLRTKKSRKLNLKSFLHESVKWSPDGKYLAFTSFMNGNKDICIVRLGGVTKIHPRTRNFVLRADNEDVSEKRTLRNLIDGLF